MSSTAKELLYYVCFLAILYVDVYRNDKLRFVFKPWRSIAECPFVSKCLQSHLGVHVLGDPDLVGQRVWVRAMRHGLGMKPC